jgi:hypothetical protein
MTGWHPFVIDELWSLQEPVFSLDAVGVALEALAVMFTWIPFDQ